jgi:acyl dehydratase
VKVGAKIRARGEITAVNQLEGAVQATTTITVEIEDSAKPAAVAESIVRYIA